jgi:hypothetical protein
MTGMNRIANSLAAPVTRRPFGRPVGVAALAVHGLLAKRTDAQRVDAQRVDAQRIDAQRVDVKSVGARKRNTNKKIQDRMYFFNYNNC